MGVTVKKTAEKPEGKVTFVQKVIKDDTYLVMASSSYAPEDEFTGLYYTTKNPTKVFLQPPFEPKFLAHLPSQNNILQQCVEAMEVNIDGTGYELVPAVDGEEKNEAEEKNLRGFLDEPYPGKSIVSIRREMRRDLEKIGWAFMEVLRNVQNDVVGLRNIPAHTIRYVRLDEPIQVTKTLTRNGKEVQLTMFERERRFAQCLAMNQFQYFREFGTTRHVNRKTGEWESATNVVAPEDRGTELLAFRVTPDVTTPYGLPRWTNQMPSVLGSRKAEEQNLEFFDAGGLPPAIIFIEGGTLAKDMADQLRMYLSGQMKARNRAVVVEAMSSSGAIDSAGSVKTRVERFGAESTKDAMFATYDKNAEEHVRTGFRLPPLFIGKAADYAYASAQVSYMVAEAQVFGPERQEFDEVFNRTIMKALGAKTCKFQSKPITMKDLDAQLKGLGLAQTAADPESFLKEVNKITGVSLELAEQPDTIAQGADEAKVKEMHGKVENKLFEEKLKIQNKNPPPQPKPVKKTAPELLKLAGMYVEAEGLVDSDHEASETDKETIRKSVDSLSAPERDLFNRFVSARINETVEEAA